MTENRERQIDNIHIKRQESAIATYREMVKEANRLLQESQEALTVIGETVAQEEMEKLNAQFPDSSKISTNKILAAIQPSLMEMKRTAEGASTFPDEVKSLREEKKGNESAKSELRLAIDRLSKENDALKKRVQKLTEDLRIEVNRKKELEEKIEAQKKSQKEKKEKERRDQFTEEEKEFVQKLQDGSITGEELESFLVLWKKRTTQYKRDTAFIRLIGRSGLCKSTDIREKFTATQEKGRGTFYRAKDNLLLLGMIEFKKEQLDTGGRPAKVFLLTRAGQEVYRLLTDKKAVDSEYFELIKTHVSPRQVAIVMQVAKEFQRLGFETNKNPVRIPANQPGRFMYPDIRAVDQDTGEVIYIEVEVGDKRKPANARKWNNAFEVGLGNIWLITDTKKAMKKHVNEILFWAGENGKGVQIYATTVDVLKAAEDKETMWARIKRYNPDK